MSAGLCLVNVVGACHFAMGLCLFAKKRITPFVDIELTSLVVRFSFTGTTGLAYVPGRVLSSQILTIRDR